MAKSSSNSIPSPKGTRDLYPDDLLRQRYITEAWRRVSIRHGFEEIAGPTFEMLDLYKKKSGEGIVSELFSFTRAGGDDDYALRPEFTPTLARMYASKAKSLPTPCKWFTAGPYFRAEKPQRGRLREFLQWNCDVMGGRVDESDADVLEVLLNLCTDLGLTQSSLTANLSDRSLLASILMTSGVKHEDVDTAFMLIDRRSKIEDTKFICDAMAIGMDVRAVDNMHYNAIESVERLAEQIISDIVPDTPPLGNPRDVHIERIAATLALIKIRDLAGFVEINTSIARGLAYYTGTVFELIADGERAVAGGGRYDNLIELFGGPPTPAVGFGMGDVVLGLLLEDKGLMPEGPALMDALSQKPASLRPEAFVIASEAGEGSVEPLLARLRRGVESEAWNARGDKKPWDADRYDVPPMHARRSYKSTKNIGKLLADARKQHAKFAVIIDSEEAAKVENLDTREDLGTFPLDQVGAKIAERL